MQHGHWVLSTQYFSVQICSYSITSLGNAEIGTGHHRKPQWKRNCVFFISKVTCRGMVAVLRPECWNPECHLLFWTNTMHPHQFFLKSGTLIEFLCSFLVGSWFAIVLQLHASLQFYFISPTVIMKTGCVAYSEAFCDLVWRGQLKKSPQRNFIRCKSHHDWIKMQPKYSYIHFTNTIILLPLFHHYRLIGGVFFFKVDGSKEFFYKHKVNCVLLKMIINSSKASVTLCDKWTRWTESVMEGQMWKL